MPDLFFNPLPEVLPIVDADLTLWRQLDLGVAYGDLLRRLHNETEWRQERISVYGKTHLQPRLSAWHGDVGYRYSGIQLSPLPWSDCLLELRYRLESLTGRNFNSVLLNYYRNQNDCMGMHSDDERELGAQPSIASLSLGDTRRFILRHKTRKELKTVRLDLPAGSLLLMQGDTQRFWRHGINRQSRSCGPRLNLTFRYVHAQA